jgi:hypothetical protein
MIPVHVYAGFIASGGAPAWTLADLPGIDFWLQPPPSTDATNGGMLTVSAGKVSAAADAAGSATVLAQATAARRPIVNTSGPLDGRYTLDWSYADDTHLESATGGLANANDPHTLIALVKITDAAPYYPVVGYGSFITYGNPNGENSHIGVQNAAGGSWWGGGGPNHGLGVGGPDLGKPLDGTWHLLMKRSTGTEEEVLIDGVEVYRGDTGCAPAAFYLGAGRWLNNASYGCSSHRSLDKVWIGQLSTDDELCRAAYYLSAEYPTTYGPMMVCNGDSMSSGYLLGSPTTEAWPYLVAAARGCKLRIHAYPGWRTYWAGNPNMRDGGNNLPQLDKDAIIIASLIFDWSGINDVNNGVTNATLKTYKEQNLALMRAKNARATIVGITLLPSTSVTGSEDVERLAHNADMAGAWGATHYDYVVDVTEIPQLANPADLTYYIDGTHLTAAGQALIAAKIKTVLPAASGAPR